MDRCGGHPTRQEKPSFPPCAVPPYRRRKGFGRVATLAAGFGRATAPAPRPTAPYAPAAPGSESARDRQGPETARQEEGLPWSNLAYKEFFISSNGIPNYRLQWSRT